MKTISMGKWLGYLIRSLSLLGLLTLSHGPLAAEVNNSQCLSCHSDSDIHAVTSDNAGAKLFIAEEAYQESVHATVPCVACHQSEQGNAGFEVLPHTQTTVATNSCESCHGLVQHKITDAWKNSVHISKTEKDGKNKFSCESCHDAHTMQSSVITKPTVQQVASSNALCTDCHTRAVEYQALSGGKKVTEQDLTHASIPNAALHLGSLRCIDCHAGSNDLTLHNIVPAKESVSCNQCHSDESILVQRRHFTPTEQNIAGSRLNQGLFDDKSLQEKLNSLGGIPAQQEIQWVNGSLFNNSYLIGANGDVRLDRAIMWLAAALLIMLALHGLLRLLISKTQSGGQWHKTYLYTLPVRIWHWLNALCFILLLVSGIAMHFSQGELVTWADLHNITGLTLCAVWVLFIAINLLGNGHHYVVKLNGLLGGLLRQTRYYLFGIFRGEAHPEHPSAQSKFNPLQQLGYVGVMYLMVPLLIVTGLLMLYPEYTPEIVFGLPGKQLVAYSHYLLASVSLLFLLVHLYLCTTGDSLSALLKGMLDGYHRHKNGGDKQ